MPYRRERRYTMRTATTILTGAFMALLAAPVAAVQGNSGSGPNAPPEDTGSVKAASAMLAPTIAIQHIRPADQRGINVCEPPKRDATPFQGVRIAFTSEERRV